MPRCLATVFLLWTFGTAGAKCSSSFSSCSRLQTEAVRSSARRYQRRKRRSCLPTSLAVTPPAVSSPFAKRTNQVRYSHLVSFLSTKRSLCIWNCADFLAGETRDRDLRYIFCMRIKDTFIVWHIVRPRLILIISVLCKVF